ncbi:MAG: thiolase family protein [Actinobacteria bacterium]|nr:thiolase family protein [Actinomycetota bacterium]MBU1945170.1 thiolase family protein [Actinomycetota bacterium]MBU2687708.1 thiolase family protein [Actinomycetota bacterium]
MREVAVAGVGMTEIGVFDEAYPADMAVRAIVAAIEDSRLEKREIQALLGTPTGYMVDHHKFEHQRIAEYLRMPVASAAEFDCGGASAMLALRHLAMEIASGRIDTGVVYASHWEISTRRMKTEYADWQHLVRTANAVYGSYDSRFGVLSPLHYYAMSQQRWMHETGVAPEQVAALPVVLRDNASRNPAAQFNEPITVEDVLASPMLSPPIHLLESCPMSNAAAAVVLATGERVRRVRDRVPVIIGYGEAHEDSHFMPHTGDMSRFPCVARSAAGAFAEAGTGPEGVNVAEVYGAFAGAELMCYEELGFFGRGEAAAAVEAGRTRIGGEIAVNTSGGRLSLGHPAYTTPLLETFEVVRQLRGEAGERQVPGAERGLVHVEHGMVNGSAVMILENA